MKTVAGTALSLLQELNTTIKTVYSVQRVTPLSLYLQRPTSTSLPSLIRVEMFVIFCLYSSIDFVFEILSKKCQQTDWI